MDDKILASATDLELADRARGGIAKHSDLGGGNMTRDDGEMAFYGQRSQLKVRACAC